MIQETIKAVKEAEAKAQQKIKDASVRAQSIISEAEKEAENIIRKSETAAGEQAASDMKAAEERAHSTENTVVGQVEEELAAFEKESGVEARAGYPGSNGQFVLRGGVRKWQYCRCSESVSAQ